MRCLLCTTKEQGTKKVRATWQLHHYAGYRNQFLRGGPLPEAVNLPHFIFIGSGVSEPQGSENRHLPLTWAIALTTVLRTNVLHCDKCHQGSKMSLFENLRWRRPPSWKIHKIVYLSQFFIDLHHNSTFCKFKMAVAFLGIQLHNFMASKSPNPPNWRE